MTLNSTWREALGSTWMRQKPFKTLCGSVWVGRLEWCGQCEGITYNKTTSSDARLPAGTGDHAQSLCGLQIGHKFQCGWGMHVCAFIIQVESA